MDTKSQIHAFNFDDAKAIDLEPITLHASLKLDPNWLYTKIINACNGLLLCRFHPNRPVLDAHVAILNPMTNEHMKVTDCDDDLYAYGLGFSPNTKQYKLVRILGVGGFRGTTRVEIFTYGGSENWRLVDSRSSRVSRTNGVYFNGFLYWFGTTNEFVKKFVCCLDVEEERFEFRTLPVDDEDFCNEAIKVCNNNVYVSMIVGIHFQVWMMESNGGGWVRYFVGDGIRVEYWEVKRNKLHHPQIVEVFEDGDILFLLYGLHLFFYNPYTGRLTPNSHYYTLSTITTPPLHHIHSFNFHPLQNILRGHTN